MKKTIGFITSLFLAIAISISASAHPGDVFTGNYTNNSQTDLKFKINTSAQTSLLTSSVYSYATCWNNICDDVHISVTMGGVGMPDSGFMQVYGKTYSDETLGEMVPYDSNGNIVDANDDWCFVRIYMNTDSSMYNGGIGPTYGAKKVFAHEVGHALKLAHPIGNYHLQGHDYSGGKPKAIMNQGIPGTGYIAYYVTDHDEANLIAKWG